MAKDEGYLSLKESENLLNELLSV